ncbi:hypothetical protein SRCM101294_02466 [Bacillus amyloliquefaciens]|nr:hypothetical protein SRCM101294_02466 [Bacillus amyloliquefaciens]
MDIIHILIFSAVFVLLSLMFQVFTVNVLGLPKPVKNQKPINGTHRLIEMSLLITGTAAVTFFNELYVFAGVISMFFCCSGLMEWRHLQEKKAICVRFVLRGSFRRTWRAYFFHPLADHALYSCGRSVSARVGSALEKAFFVNNDRCCVSHKSVKIANGLNAVAALL